MAIRSLADQWDVTFLTSDLLGDIPEVNKRQFELYERGAPPTGQSQELGFGGDQALPPEVFDELFQAWAFDQNMGSMAFDFAGEG